MRTKFAIKNITINIFSQIILIVLGFIARKIFLDSLGSEYLGVNGVLTNVLSALVLIEGGVGVSITYNLYKPLAEDNKEKIIALIQVYKKVYFILAGIIFAICSFIFPFVGIILKTDNDIYGIDIIYWIFVIKNIISYINSHKYALINADQKGYILSINNLMFQVLTIIFKIIILLITKNYILYVSIDTVLFLIQNIINSRIVNKRYPYIKTKKKYSLDIVTKKNIIKNVKAMFIQNIGSYAIFSTDNIIISAFINVSSVGLYSNYTMITGQIASLVSTVISGISNGVGNLVATEGDEKIYLIFNISNTIAFGIYSISAIFLTIVLEPFINWWLGEGYLLDKITFYIIIINFYMAGMHSIINIFKSKSGLFAEDKYMPLVQGAINLVLSIVLIKYFDLAGVFLGTLISFTLTSFWNQPRIVYRKVFNKSVRIYFRKYIVYLILALSVGFLTRTICNLLGSEYNLFILCAKGFISLAIPTIIYCIVFYKTKEFKYLIDTFVKRKNKLNLNRLELKSNDNIF